MRLREWEEGQKVLFEPVKEERRGRRFVVDENLKVCNHCGQVWEKVNFRVHNVRYMIYPIGAIPRIGKEKQPCPRCK